MPLMSAPSCWESAIWLELLLLRTRKLSDTVFENRFRERETLLHILASEIGLQQFVYKRAALPTLNDAKLALFLGVVQDDVGLILRARGLALAKTSEVVRFLRRVTVMELLAPHFSVPEPMWTASSLARRIN